jgi:signal transduction histidine kinase/DNA-binding response OmpR family regulator/HAMP domain-containing protein
VSRRGGSIAGTLRVALVGLTVGLAVLGAIAVAALYDARQQYEDRLAETAALEVAAANLLSAAVALESNLARPQTPRSTPFVARAARELDQDGGRVRALAHDDGPSRELVAQMSGARRAARVLAQRPQQRAARVSATRELPDVRRAVRLLAARQGVRRESARARATHRGRLALAAIGLSTGLALVAVLAFLALLIRTMRRPLDDLVDATRRMAAGDLAVRVDADGPREIAALGESFNVMSADLAVAGARLESQRQRLATTIESLGDGLVICDADDVVTAMNPRAGELVAQLRPGAVAHDARSPLPAGAAALAGEVTVVHEGVTMAVTAARLAGPDDGTVWTLRDITERARLEQAKSDFVATASHELRSPLTSIKGFIELLALTENDNLTPRQLEFIQIALQSTDRLVDLVNDLLAVARIESGHFQIHPRSCDLRAVVEEVAELMRPRVEEKRQRLVIQIDERRPPALADPVRVRQIVTNLLTNAHLYTAENGTITLRLEGDAHATRIAVVDNGRGMSAEDTRRIFDRFYRSATDERRNPGTGLGLSIVKSLVELHGGVVDVRSELGAGTTFEISLPSAPQGEAGAGRAVAPPLAAHRVLIVDDEPSLAALIAQQLEPLGVHSVQVHSGVEALARLRTEHFDAMTLDVMMPGMNGIEVLEAVRSEPSLRDLPVIFVSVSSTLSQLEGEWAVSKPIDRRRLSEVLRTAIQAKRSRVLVVAPDAVRVDVAPSLAALGIEYRWESSAQGAARAGSEQLFEVALVHASMSQALTLLEGAALRGRRGGRSVILFSTGGGAHGLAGGVGMPVFPLAQAIGALRATLGEEASGTAPGAAPGR